MDKKSIFHSIEINRSKCIGCVTCMKICPTRAIRIKDQKAMIIEEKCVDCGECLRVCGYQAIEAITSKKADISEFKYKIAVPSPVLYTQFGGSRYPGEILASLKRIGFDYVYDEALMCEMSSIVIEDYLRNNKIKKPVISSTCPSAIRLIQRLFPSLCDLIIPFEPPREVAAKNLLNDISLKTGIDQSEIGIFHITPCPAKLVSIHSPLTLERSFLDGAIPISEVYDFIVKDLKKSYKSSITQMSNTTVSGIGTGWTIPDGEVRSAEFFTVSVSGVYDTIRILQDVEANKLKNIDYLQCLICPDGCIGGPFTVENRFIAKSNVFRLMRMTGGKPTVDKKFVRELYKEGFFSFEMSIQPKPISPLDKDRERALEKLNLKRDLRQLLPGLDCGICGAPDCDTLAEDITMGRADLNDCLFKKGGKK